MKNPNQFVLGIGFLMLFLVGCQSAAGADAGARFDFVVPSPTPLPTAYVAFTPTPTLVPTPIPTPSQDELMEIFQQLNEEFFVEENVSPSGTWIGVETRSVGQTFNRTTYQYVLFEIKNTISGKAHQMYEGVIETRYESMGFDIVGWNKNESKVFSVQWHSGDGCFPIYYSNFQEIDLETGDARNIGPASSAEFSLSPNEEYLASIFPRNLELTISTLDGADRTVQLDYFATETDSYVVWWMSGLTWSPDSSFLALEVVRNACFGDEAAIVLVNIATMETIELIGFDKKLRRIEGWGTEGISFEEISDSETRVWVVDPDSGTLRQIP